MTKREELMNRILRILQATDDRGLHLVYRFLIGYNKP